MNASRRTTFCSAVLAFVLILNAQPVLAHKRDPYEGRLFLIVTPSEGEIFDKKGFVATCGSATVWFEQTTELEARQRGQEVILFEDVVRDVFNRNELQCFTKLGNFVSCKLAEAMESKVDGVWVTCRGVSFNEEPATAQLDNFNDISLVPLAKNSEPLPETNVLSHVADHISRYAVGYVAASISATALVSLFAWYKVHQANLKLKRAKPIGNL